MAEGNFSWIVVNSNGTVFQVDADRVKFTDDGAAAFYRDYKDSEYLSCWFACGTIDTIQVTSQLTGYPNGYTVLTRSETDD